MGTDEMNLLVESRVNEFNRDSEKVKAEYSYDGISNEFILRETAGDKKQIKKINVFELSSMMNPRGYLDWVLDEMRRRILNG